MAINYPHSSTWQEGPIKLALNIVNKRRVATPPGSNSDPNQARRSAKTHAHSLWLSAPRVQFGSCEASYLSTKISVSYACGYHISPAY